MKIMFVAPSFSAGGAERVVSIMANYWISRGWEVCITTVNGRRDEDFYYLEPQVRRKHVNINSEDSHLPGKIWSNIRRVDSLRRIFREFNPNVVISFIDTANVLSIIASLGLKHRMIASERVDPSVNPTISLPWRVLRLLTYPFADYIVAQTRPIAEWLEKRCINRVAVIPNPLRQVPSMSIKREPILLAIGRLHHQKGFDLLLRAFAPLKDRFPNWRLVILGEGPERAALNALSKSLELHDRVAFLGVKKNIDTWLARASVQVQPSRFEGFPNVILEGMAAGLPVVATDCRSGPREIIQSGENGILVPIENVGSLSTAIALLIGSQGKRAELGSSAKKVREYYALERIMRLWEALLASPSLPSHQTH